LSARERAQARDGPRSRTLDGPPTLEARPEADAAMRGRPRRASPVCCGGREMRKAFAAAARKSPSRSSDNPPLE